MWPLVPQPPEKSKENKMKQHAKCGETLPGKEMIFQGCITIVYVFRTRAKCIEAGTELHSSLVFIKVVRVDVLHDSFRHIFRVDKSDSSPGAR